MKRLLRKIIKTIKKFLLWLFKIIGIKIENPIEAKPLQNGEQQKEEHTEYKSIKETTEDTDSSATHDLRKEHFFIKQTLSLSSSELEEHFNSFIEKTLKLKINTFSKETKKKFTTYREKTIKKIEKQMENQPIENIEELEQMFKKHLEKDLEKQNLTIEKVKENPLLYTKTENKEENVENTDFNRLQKEPQERNQIIEPFPFPIKEKESVLEVRQNKVENINLSMESKKEVQEEKEKMTIIDTPKPLPSDPFIEHRTIPIYQEPPMMKQQEENRNKETTIETTAKEDIVIAENMTKNNLQNLEKEQEIKNTQNQNPTNEIHKDELTKENPTEKEQKKEEIKSIPEKRIEMNTLALEIENEQIIEKAKIEEQKEDLIDKNYEQVEKLLEEKIKEIEQLLQKPLSKTSEKKLKNELKKLKETKNKLALYEEKDAENLRISLEENIPLDELVLVTEKLQKYTNDQEIQKKEMLYKDIEKKTQKELDEMERILLKESYKKALKRLEIPLFLSFPFIKNKFFRNCVSSLFIFRTFGFVKNLLFGFPNTYEPLDLSYIQKGSDALKESISLTEKNRQDFIELKRATLLKHPELADDEDFMKDLNKLEENLKQNYEKLLKQDKLVNKYFDKSKVLVRKRKK